MLTPPCPRRWPRRREWHTGRPSISSLEQKGAAGRNDPKPGPPVWVVSYPEPRGYRQVWDLQRRIWSQRHAGLMPDTLLLLEHEPVVTLGKNARRQNLLLSESAFRERGCDLFEVDRGGDVTYHGPGQLVGYWIFDLRALYQDVHRFLREIEEVLIRLLSHYGIRGERSNGATGVWVMRADGRGEKVAAMGLHLSHWVSTHGFALNVNADLEPFNWIVPCGLHGRGVTSLHRLLGASVGRRELEARLVGEVAEVFGRSPVSITPGELEDALLGLERGRSEECRV